MESGKQKRRTGNHHPLQEGVRIDQLDGWYEGQLNWSHQKHGVGIFISQQFDAYLGEWKNNHLHGRGCVIFRNGRLLLGQFNRDQPYGLVIIQTSEKIVCGTLEATEVRLVGVAFEYEYRQTRWRMLHCERNIYAMPTHQCTTVLAEEDRELSRGPPRIMSGQPEIFSFVGQFINDRQSVFTFSGKKLLTKAEGRLIFGGCNAQHQPHGLAVVMRKEEIDVVGMFDSGKPHGFVFQSLGRAFSAGLYDHGRKHGIFQELQHENSQTVIGEQYLHGEFVATIEHDKIAAAMLSQHRKYLDRSKNYISIRNMFTFRELEEPFVKVPAPLERPVHQEPTYVRKRMIVDRKDPESQEPDKKPTLATMGKERLSETRQRRRTVQFEESCLATVRKRMPYLEKLMRPDVVYEEDSDAIAQEENPFS